MKKIILTVVLLFCALLFYASYASSFNFSAEPDEATVKPGDEISISLKISDIDAGTEGINVVETTLTYDKSIIENVSFVDKNNWKSTYNPNEGNLQGKLLYTKMVSGVKNDEEIGVLKVKIKEGLTNSFETELKLAQVTSNDGYSLINIGDKKVKLSYVSPTPTPQPEPTTDPIPTEEPKTESTGDIYEQYADEVDLSDFPASSIAETLFDKGIITTEMQQIKDKAIANGTFMKAPNGNPTNLNERQWLQVRTKAFKDWFGDWENVAPKRIFEHSLFRGQAGKPKINENGDLILHPTYDTLSKNTGISFANVESAAIEYGSRYSKNPYIIEIDADFLDKTHPLKESTESGGRFIGDEYGDNAWEERISDTKDIIIPKGYYKIEEPSADIFISMSNSDIAQKIHELEELFNNQDEWADEAFAPRTSISEIKFYEDELERRRKYGVTKKVENVGIQHYSSFIHHTIEHNGKYYIVEDGDTFGKSEIEISKKDYEEFNKNGGIDIETFETRYYTNSPINNVSKVVDENGEPLVVYHHRKSELNDFSKRTDNVFPGIYFSKTPFTWFGPVQIAAFLNIKNPAYDYKSDTLNNDQIEDYKYLGNDGVFGTDFEDETNTKILEYVAFDANQIKSATDNTGIFSREDNDIYDELSIASTTDFVNKFPIEDQAEVRSAIDNGEISIKCN